MPRLPLISTCIALAIFASGPALPAHASNRNLPYRGGPVMHHPAVYPIYWLPDGYHFYPDGSAHTDQNFEDLTQGLLADLSGSPFYGLVTQYHDRKGHIADSYDVQDGIVDSTAFPGDRGSLDNPLRDADIRAEIAQVVDSEGITNTPGETLFIVYTPYGVHSCTAGNPQKHVAPTCDYRGGNSGWCGYHSWFSSHGSRYIYAAILGVTSFCHHWQRVLTDDSSPNSDARGDIAADTTSHELFEAVTDPYFNAWAASGSDEIGDKCSSAIGPVADDGSDITLAGDPYLLQKEWSNAQHGCVIF